MKFSEKRLSFMCKKGMYGKCPRVLNSSVRSLTQKRINLISEKNHAIKLVLPRIITM